MTPQEEIRFRQMMANQMSARQPMLRDQMPDMNPTPPYGALPIATPTPRNPLEEAARFRGLLGPAINYRPPYSREEIERLMRDEEINRVGPKPYARGLRPPTDAERERFDATNPEMPLNDLARARLEAERPFNPGSTRFPDNPYYYTGGTPDPYANDLARARLGDIYDTPPSMDQAGPVRPPETMAEYYRRMGINPGYRTVIARADTPPGVDFGPADYRITSPGSPPLPPIGGEMAADPEPEEYDGFVDSGTGQRGFMGDKYMPAPMDQAGPSSEIGMADNTRPPTDAERANRDAGYALALSDPEEYDRRVQAYYRRPVAEGQQRTMEGLLSAADVVASRARASTAYNAPPVANTAYMPPPTAESASTAYNAPPVANTAYMPSRRTVPVDTTYRPPAQANTTYMPSSAPTYGMSSTPSYGMSNAQTTTPTYGGQIREPSFSPNQAGKYKVDGPRLKNTGGLFNDLNAFFGRPQT
jgi:hypothetical protein